MKDNDKTLFQINDNVRFILFFESNEFKNKKNLNKLGKVIRKKNSAPKFRLAEHKRIASNLANMSTQL